MGMEFNKLFAALLVAGIAAYATGFVATQIVSPQTELAENAYPVDVPDTPAGAATAAAPAAAEPIDDLMANADIAHGERLSRLCAACHTFDKGGANRVGPNLSGIVGSKHAHQSSFAYSDAMKAKSGETWTVEGLNEYLFNPRRAVPGTKMVFAGLKKAEDRAALIKWLQTK